MSIWEDEFKCWNTDEPILPQKRWTRFCEVCGANKPVENHETWCPNEPDRILKDDLDFWYDNAEGDECECGTCSFATEHGIADDDWTQRNQCVREDQPLNDEHESHINRILDAVNTELSAKYRKGQQEHGGKLWLKPDMLDHAIEEVLDLIVYLYTLREQQQNGSGV